MALDKVIFENKTLSDLFKEIYDNSRKKDKQINAMVAELKVLIEGIDDATLVVPMIKEYLEIAVKNDEHLIKMAQIVQRMEANVARSGENAFDPLELSALIEEMEQNIPQPLEKPIKKE
jgi:hypothetical protein